MQPELRAVGFKKKKDVLHCSVPSKPPWLLKRPQIDFSMHAFCKESTPPEIYRAKYYEICDQYQDYCKLYTDGSMSGDQVGSSTICGTTTKTVRLPNGVSIFRAELYAITMALNIIYHRKENYFIIFSDSMSSLQAGVSQFCLKKWQDIWNCCEGNKLRAIYPNVGRIPHCKNLSRRDAVVINRLRIGHTRLTHLHLLTGEDLPTCQFCSVPLTVNHILLECANLNTTRQRFFRVRPLRISLIALTIKELLILSKKLIFTFLYNVCYPSFMFAL